MFFYIPCLYAKLLSPPTENYFWTQDADDRESLIPDLPKKKERAESEVDLETDRSLVVDISDALSEQDKVKYTVHTKVWSG